MRSLPSPLGCSLLLAAVLIGSAAAQDVEARHPGLTSEFDSLVRALRTKSVDARAAFAGSGHAERAIPIVNLKGEALDEIEAYIWVEAWSDSVRREIESLGAVITGEDPDSFILQAWLPLNSVEAIAEVKGVRHIRRPAYGIATAGNIRTEGDAALTANFLRTLGRVDGNGIQVGVLSTGLFNPLFTYGSTQGPRGSNGDARVVAGNLPAFADDATEVAPRSRFLGAVEVFPPSLDLHRAVAPFTSTGYINVRGGDRFNFRGDQVVIQGVSANAVSLQIGLNFGSAPTGRATFIGDFEVTVDAYDPTGFAIINISFNPSGVVTPPEGAAMLEIIHDIAPKAQLFYARANTSVELRNGRSFLRSRGVDVIVDNMTFFDVGRYDGTSVLSQEARQLAQSDDIVYIVSGGNYTAPPANPGLSASNLAASSGRFPLFINAFFDPRGDSGASKVHNFASGRIGDVRDDYLTLLPQNGIIDVALVWDDIWDNQNPRATDDLDLVLHEIRGSQIGSIVASSTDVQNNSGIPYERITATPGETRYALFVRRKNSADSSRRLFTLLILQGTVAGEDVKYLTHGVPLNNSDALAPVISVGAIDLSTGGSQMFVNSTPGLSPGPGREASNSYVQWLFGQRFPAVVSYSNVSTQSTSQIGGDGAYIVNPFTGTSAAAAHVGGAVALLRHVRRTIPSFEFYDLLRDTSTAGRDFPNAVVINPEVNQFGNAPRFVRPNPYDIWANLTTAPVKAVSRQAVPVPTFGQTTAWEHSGPISNFAVPEFGNINGVLTISANGQNNAAGWWQSPIFEFLNEDGEPTTALRDDRIYELTARVGSDETDPTKVPNFRLRLITGQNDEAVTMDISGMTMDASNTPTTLSGKEYRLYYRPTNTVVASHGVRFAFDLAGFDPLDNTGATLFLNEVTLRELPIEP